MANISTVPNAIKEGIPGAASSLGGYFSQRGKVSGPSVNVGVGETVKADIVQFYKDIIENRYECIKDQQCVGTLSKNLADELYANSTIKSATDNEKISREKLEQIVKEDLQYKADDVKYKPPNTPSPNVGEPANSDSGVGLKDTPTASTPAQSESATSVVSADNRNAYAEYRSTERNIPSQRFNSWILSWEPTQKVGVVKVPISKIISSLGANAFNESNNANPFQDATLFDVSDLINFDGINKRIFLPLSSNKLILLKDFSMQRKNIQSAEITYGSRYFQVFAENFPDFTMQIDVVVFHETAKKVKLFFDNVMKRISETSRYSGSLYIHDVLAQEIPAFDAVRLSNLVNTNQLTKYRLLPRSIRINRSSEDTNMMKITIEGIVVEWEKQDESIIKLVAPTSPATQSGSKDKALVSGGSSANSNARIPNSSGTLIDPSTGKAYRLEVNQALLSSALISPAGEYSSSFNNLELNESYVSSGGTDQVIVNRIIRRIGNTLYKTGPDAIKQAYSSTGDNVTDSLWNIEWLSTRGTGLGSNFGLTEVAKKELIADTQSLYQQIATKLSNAYKDNQNATWYDNVYNSVLGRAIKDLELPVNQHKTFEKGMRLYLRTFAGQNNKDSLARKLVSYKILTQEEYDLLYKFKD